MNQNMTYRNRPGRWNLGLTGITGLFCLVLSIQGIGCSSGGGGGSDPAPVLVEESEPTLSDPLSPNSGKEENPLIDLVSGTTPYVDLNQFETVTEQPLTVEIDRAGGQEDVTTESPVRFQFSFSEEVELFKSDLTWGGTAFEGTVGQPIEVVISPESLSDTFIVEISGMTLTGTVWVYFPTPGGATGETIIHDNEVTFLEWNEQGFPTKSDFKDVQFTDPLTGWAIAATGIFHTADGGETWAIQDGTRDLNAIHMINAETGFAVGMTDAHGLGQILEYDQGSWYPVGSPSIENLNDVWLVSTTEGWAVGENGTTLKYDGTTWNKVPRASGRNYNKVRFFDANHGYIAADGGTLDYTTNGGVLWGMARFGDNTVDFLGMNLLTATRGVLVGTGGNVVLFELPEDFEALPPIQRFRLDDIFILDDRPVTQDLHDIFFINESQGWAVGEDGIILYTEDGGINWTIQSNPVAGTSTLNAVFFLDPEHGWAVGDHERLYSTRELNLF